MKISNIRLSSFVILIIFVWFLQNHIFKLNLSYGFRDGDWWIIRRFLSFGPLSFDHLINAWKSHAVYTYQVYYSGFLTSFLGLDFPNLYQANHFFKFLATLSVYPLILVITKNKLTASLTTIIYSVAYPTAGALYMFLTGGYFIAIIFLNFFLLEYWNVLNKRVLKIKWLLLTLFLFLATLILNTERMYPLIPLVLIIEFLWIWKYNWAKLNLKISLIRISVLLLPLVFFYSVYMIWFKNLVTSAFFTPQFFKAIELRFESIQSGNWQLLLYPFASYGSMFLYGDYLKFLGNFNTENFASFLSYFILKPLLILSIPTIFLMYFISKKPLRLILITLAPTFIFGLVIFLMAKNWLGIEPNIKIHFDTNFVGRPALFGFYLLALSFSFLIGWIENNDKRNLLAPIFIGSVVAFFFIFFTWIGSDTHLLFMGPQRYLTAPAIGSSLVLASLITFVFSRLGSVKAIRHFAWFCLLVIIPIILINAKLTKEFFNYELNVVGMDGTEQTRMKSKFWKLVPEMSNTESSLFYFDETADKENGYFDESTVLAGFEDWTQFDHGRLMVVNRPNPGMLRTNVQCPQHTHQNCLQILKEGLDVRNGEKGFFYIDPIRVEKEPKFYKLSNFYAIRFINKDMVDIRDEVLKDIGITDE